jgi:hypothetical protein
MFDQKAITKILLEVYKRAVIGYPPTDHLDQKRTIIEATTAILDILPKKKKVEVKQNDLH